MRVLFVVPPLVGHVNPTIAVAAELTARGHQVAWTGPAAALAPLLPAGSLLYAAGDGDAADSTDVLHGRWRDLRGIAALRFLWAEVLIPLARAMLPGVHTAVEAFAPDVLVADQQALAGPLVARRHGLPWATSATTSAEFTRPFEGVPKVGEWVAQRIAALLAESGAPSGWDPRFSPHLVLVFSTPALIGDGGPPGDGAQRERGGRRRARRCRPPRRAEVPAPLRLRRARLRRPPVRPGLPVAPARPRTRAGAGLPRHPQPRGGRPLLPRGTARRGRPRGPGTADPGRPRRPRRDRPAPHGAPGVRPAARPAAAPRRRAVPRRPQHRLRGAGPRTAAGRGARPRRSADRRPAGGRVRCGSAGALRPGPCGRAAPGAGRRTGRAGPPPCGPPHPGVLRRGGRRPHRGRPSGEAGARRHGPRRHPAPPGPGTAPTENEKGP